MGELELAEVRRIAQLARLKLAPEAETVLRRQLRAILDYVALLDEVDLPDTAGSSPATPATRDSGGLDDLRGDRPRPSLRRDEALASAPEAQDGHFRVPRILS